MKILISTKSTKGTLKLKLILILSQAGKFLHRINEEVEHHYLTQCILFPKWLTEMMIKRGESLIVPLKKSMKKTTRSICRATKLSFSREGGSCCKNTIKQTFSKLRRRRAAVRRHRASPIFKDQKSQAMESPMKAAENQMEVLKAVITTLTKTYFQYQI